jgi:hypothetical protein
MRNSRNIFSVEITSKKHVRRLSVSDEAFDRVLFEGDLGELLSLALIEDKVLEIEGQNGVLRTSMNVLLLQSLLENPKHVLNLGSKLESDIKMKEKMKRKSTALMIVILVALTLVPIVLARSNMYLEMQCEITGVTWGSKGNALDVTFSGVASGPEIIGGKVEGVDYVWIDANNVTNLNVFYTVTDKNGDKVSVNVVGKSIEQNKGRAVFEDATATVINTAEYPTTGKFGYLEGTIFRDEGFLTALKLDLTSMSISGRIHAKWFWD